MAQRLGDLLEAAVARSGATEQVRAAQVLGKAEGVIRSIFGDDIGAFVQPRSYRHGVLQCGAATTTAADAVRMRQDEVLTELRKAFPGLQFERLVIRIS